MVARMRNLVGLFFCLVLIVGTLPQPVAAQGPIAAGKWTGYFERKVTIKNEVSGVSITADGYGKGNLEFDVTADGHVTGSITGYHAEISWAAPAVSVKGFCTFDGELAVKGGTVSLDSAGLPVFDLDVVTTQVSYNCDPAVNSAPEKPTHLVMQSKTFSGGKMTGEKVRFDTDMVEQVLSSLSKIGAKASVTEYWELNSSGASVDVITAETEQYFLAGVPFQNTYTALIDWHNNPPGSVEFSLAGNTQTVPGEPDITAAFDLGKVPAGNNPLQVTAIGADGTPSGTNSYAVIIVPLEPWAQKANFKAAEKKMDGITPVVIYRGKAGVPEKPIQLPYLDMSWLPALGGKWGIPPFQTVVNLSANSGGGLSDAEPVTGNAGLFLGGKTPDMSLKVDGKAMTNLTATDLLFDHGQVNFNLSPTTFEHKVGVVDLIPGLQSVYKIPILGDLVKSLNGVAGIGLQVTASATGQADLGVAPDQSQLVFTQGQITPVIEMMAKPGLNIFNLAWLILGGGGQGKFTIRIAPNPELEQCVVSLKFTADVGVIGLFQDQESQLYQLVQCKSVSLNGKPGLALYMPIRTQAKPVTSVAKSVPQSNQAERSASTALSGAAVFERLVKDSPAMVAYSLAAVPQGKAAFAYTGTASDGIRLRLLSGGTWGQPISLSDGSQADFSPAVGFDPQGQVMVTWVSAGQPADSQLTQAFVQSWEIAYALVDTAIGQVVTRGSVTKDQVMDFAPQLAQAGDGSLRLAWLQSPGRRLWGTADEPNRLLSAKWNGKQWESPETVADRVVGALSYRLAAYSQDQALVVADQDMDGDPLTAADREVFAYRLQKRDWQAVQLSQNEVLDIFPLAAYLPSGEPVVVWDQGGAPVLWRGSQAGASQALALPLEGGAPAPDLSTAVLLAGGDGELLLAWAGFSPQGSQIWYSRLPASAAEWEAPIALVGGLEAAAGLTAQVDASGEVWLALADQHASQETLSEAGISLKLRGVADHADLGVAHSTGLLAARPASVGLPSAGPWSNLWLLGIAGLGVLLVGGIAGLAFLRRRRNTHSS